MANWDSYYYSLLRIVSYLVFLTLLEVCSPESLKCIIDWPRPISYDAATKNGGEDVVHPEISAAVNPR